MALDAQRSIDVAEVASVDLMTLNNKIVSMRNTVKKAKAHVIQRVIRSVKSLSSKKGSDEKLEKNKRKSERLLEEIQVIKHLKADKISKFALGNTISLAELCKMGKASVESRALTRVSENQLVQKFVNQFRNQHGDWQALAAYLLMKQSGRRYKKKKNRVTTAKIDTNIKARETMMQAYLEKKLDREVDPEILAKGVQERERKKGRRKEKLNFKDKTSDSISKVEEECRKDLNKDDETKLEDCEESDSDGPKESVAELRQAATCSPTKKTETKIACTASENSENSCDNSGSLSTKVDDSKHKNQVKTGRSTSADSKQNVGISSSENTSSKKSVAERLSDKAAEKQDARKQGLKLQVLQQMFSSKGSESSSDSEDEVIQKRILDSEGGPDSSEDDSDESTSSQGDLDKVLAVRLDNNDREPKKPKGSDTMVVKKISLKELGKEEDLVVQKGEPEEKVPAILTMSSSEVRKTRDAFFAHSDEEGEDSSDADRQEDEDESRDSDEDGDAEDNKTTLDSTFIGTLAHKRRLKRGNFNRNWDNDDRNFRGSSFRGRGASGSGSRFSRGSGHGDFRGRGQGFRGRGDARTGRGSHRTFGNNDSRGQMSGGQRSNWEGHERHHDKMSTNFNPKRKEQEDKTSPKKSGEFGQTRVTKSEVLHPSWEASKRKKGQLGIQQFQGKRIKFDD